MDNLFKGFANPSQTKTKLTTILKGLESADEMFQLQAVMELSELLSLATEDTLRNFQVDVYVPLLVKLLSYEHNPEMMIFAIRCLNYLMEALPNSSSSLVSHGVVPKFCEMLLSLQFIDIAENIFQCLEKLSYDHGAVILKASGLEAALNALDFFPTETQFVAVRLAANCCRSVVPENWTCLSSNTIQILTGLISTDRDKKVLEQGIVAFSRLCDNAYGDAKKILSFSEYGLITNLARILATAKSLLSSNSYTLVIQLLSTMLLNCPDLAKAYFQEGMIEIISEIILSTGTDSTDRMIEVLTLAHNLLPALPADMMELITPTAAPRVIKKQPKEKKEKAKEKDPRLSVITGNPQFLIQFGKKLLDPLIQVFSSSVNPTVRQRSLLIIAKNIYFGTSEMLTELLREIPFSSLLAGLLSSSDHTSIALSLKMAEILLEKLPKIFLVYFTREGVISELDTLGSLPLKPENESQEPSTTHPFGLATKQKDSSALQNWIIKHAKTIKQTHFKQNKSLESESLQKLKSILPTLHKHTTSSNQVTEEERQVLETLAQILTSSDNITPYEILQAALVDHLLAWLTISPSSASSSQLTLADIQLLENRAKLFNEVFCSPKTEQDAQNSAFSFLVKKLHSALNTTESFQVVIGDHPDIPQTLRHLTQPLKVQFKRDANEDKYEPWGGNQTLVEPLAKIESLQQFLLPRITSKQDDISLAKRSPEPSSEQITTKKMLRESYEDEEDYEDEEEEYEEEEEVAITEEFDPSFSRMGLQLCLKMGNTNLNPSQSFFKVLQSELCKELNEKNPVPQPLFKLWENVHSVSYCSAPKQPQVAEDSQALHPLESSYAKLLRRDFPFDLSSVSSKILKLFILLDYFNTNRVFSTTKNTGSLISPSEFISKKLTAKLTKQFQDPISLCASSFPDWCYDLTHSCPFLFSVETRTLFFQCTSDFGIARSLNSLHLYTQFTGRNQQDVKTGRIPRQKVRVSREAILDSAIKVMNLYAKSKAILEVEYFNEVGTGLGPTLEFYTLTSQALQSRKLGLWQEYTALKNPNQQTDPEQPAFVSTYSGLFPTPIKAKDDPKATEKKTELFKFIGRLVAKSLLDSRLLDLPLSAAFLKWMIGREEELTIEDLNQIDPAISSSLQHLIDAVQKKIEIESSPVLSVEEKKQKIQAIKFRNDSSIDDLLLDFTYQGTPLKPNGADIDVTMDNLQEYVELIIDYYLFTGVKPFFKAFRSGFNEVFPIERCSCFSLSELTTLICGIQKIEWDTQTLLDSTTCSHGHSHNSKAVKWLFEVMCEMNQEDRRQFVMFITGSATLPAGGLKNLGGKLSIVRKEPDSKDIKPDNILPSVNTCFYFIKLPEYSSKELLKERLFTAMYGTSGFQMN